MKQRISAGAIIIKDSKILLVHHKKDGQFDFWVPPGGGLENDEGIFKCVEREVFEETNLIVKPNKIAYLEELIDDDKYICKIWVICSIIGGTLGLCNLEAEESFLQDAKFFSFGELKNIKVYPDFIKTTLWEDYKEGFPQIKYVGFRKDNMGKFPPNNCEQPTTPG
ncbi:MAG: NUDIX hydrolase [Caldiserica bacterium]|nr:NUDIX hydrolase [Caldisericota bacterium]